jgi:glycogen debranching enzyme
MDCIQVVKTYVENPYVAENTFLGQAPAQEPLPVYEKIKGLLPQPVWPGHEAELACYQKAWELAFRHLGAPTKENGFVSNYIDTMLNKCIFMWDSCFMLMFGRYGIRAFNFQQTLDNFYAKQHPDGFISREIDEINGTDRFPRFDPVSTGPNIMPWAEWEYFLNFGDEDRLRRVFPPLLAYYQWTRAYRTWPDGGYWSSGWGCGMDNQPRMEKGYHPCFSHGNMVWLDACMQQMMSAELLCKMAQVIGREEEVEDLKSEAAFLKGYLNEKLWNEEDAFYYDLWRGGRQNKVKSLGAYWALMADVVPKGGIERFVGHLTNEKEFWRPHPLPTLSADNPEYKPTGGYWLGGVWAPTNYMVLTGLRKHGYDRLAHEIAVRHLSQVTQVFLEKGTIWENYAPEFPAPGDYAKPDFVGWSGLVPIAVLFEHVFGIRPEVPENTIVWDVRLLEEHGIERYPFGKDGLFTLHCAKRESAAQRPKVTCTGNRPVKVRLIWEGGSETLDFA